MLGECVVGARVADRLDVQVGGKIRPPKKTRDRAPVYPEVAREAWIQGIVILEAIISPTGCVRNLRVVRSVHPFLELAALQAVAKWRYQPTMLDDTPVAVVMTVTVNFTLN